MTWTDMTRDWAVWYKKLQSRFPNLDDGAMAFAKTDRSQFECYLAEIHNLSLTEAQEEIEDFLFVQTLILESEGDHEAA